VRRFRSEVSVGDLVLAVKRLGVDDAALAQEVARLLGLAPAREPVPVEERKLPFQPPLPEPEKPPPPPPKPPALDPLDSTLKPSTSEVDLWLPPAEVSPLQQTRASAGAAPEPPVEPLFLANWTRAILSSALSTNGDDGPLDFDRIAEALGRAEIPAQLPRLPRPTTRRGVQLLVDKAEAMTFFAGDQASLQEAARNAIGSDNVKVLRFAGCPPRGVRASAAEDWKPYAPPLPGTPVLLLTDLGVGRPMFSDERADEREWLAFASRVRRAGCPLVAFVPYEQRRWPRALRRAMTIVEWDRRTSAVTIRGLLARAHQVRV
jgi:hypothetical protein